MAQLINVDEIGDLQDRPALAQFVNAVNASTSSPTFDVGELVASVITGAVRAIDALEARVIELERR